MKACRGNLVDDGVIVDDPKDFGRLYTRSHFGRTLPGNRLRLNFVEASFLHAEDKLRIFHKGKQLSFEQIVRIASDHDLEFETHFLSFGDLRIRGHALSQTDIPGVSFVQYRSRQEQDNESPYFWLKSIAERDIFDIGSIEKIAKRADEKKSPLWFAIVDEEGDITYYHITPLSPTGKIAPQKRGTVKGLLLGNRVIVFDKNHKKELHASEFFGKPFGDALQLSLVEAQYLIGRDELDIHDAHDDPIDKEEFKKRADIIQPDIDLRSVVYKDLKRRELIIKTGFKFGTHFRVYSRLPGEVHAEYLIHAVPKEFTSNWSVVGRAIRLAHSVNKEMVFALVDSDDTVSYIRFGRLRP